MTPEPQSNDGLKQAEQSLTAALAQADALRKALWEARQCLEQAASELRYLGYTVHAVAYTNALKRLAALAAAPSSTEPRQDAPAPCADRVISGIIIPSGPPPNVEQALRNFVNAVEAYKETGVWPDNSTIRQLADEGMDALKWSGPDAPAQVSAPDEQAQAQ